jgi:hypothetical protein
VREVRSEPPHLEYSIGFTSKQGAKQPRSLTTSMDLVEVSMTGLIVITISTPNPNVFEIDDQIYLI